jgi:hypothetical protein
MSHMQHPVDVCIALLELLSNRFGPVQQSLLGFFDVGDEAHLRGAYRQFPTFSLGYRNWDYMLNKFFSSATKFRNLQAQYNGIVSGHVVLDFFARTNYFILNDLVLIMSVPKDSLEAAIAYFQDKGYVTIIEVTETYRKYSLYQDETYRVCEYSPVHYRIRPALRELHMSLRLRKCI